MDKKIIGILLTALIALVSTASLSYFVFSQPNEAGNTANSPSPTPTPTLEPTSSTPTPASSPSEEPNEPTSIPKPSVPEFTMKLVDNSYDVPLTYTYEIDPFTGEEVQISSGGYHVENKSLVFTIKNQQFTPCTVKDGNVTNLHYKIRVKGHFAEDWTELGYIDSTDAETTIKAYALGENSDIYMLRGVTSGGQVDFQVQALIGYAYEVYDYDTHSGLFYLYFPGETCFTGETSGWSSTQTLTYP